MEAESRRPCEWGSGGECDGVRDTKVEYCGAVPRTAAAQRSARCCLWGEGSASGTRPAVRRSEFVGLGMATCPGFLLFRLWIPGVLGEATGLVGAFSLQGRWNQSFPPSLSSNPGVIHSFLVVGRNVFSKALFGLPESQ